MTESTPAERLRRICDNFHFQTEGKGCLNHPDFVAEFRRKEIADIRALIAENERLSQFKAAFNIWMEKTEWVQDFEFSFSPLGMHRADAMRKQIDLLRSALKPFAAEYERPARGGAATAYVRLQSRGHFQRAAEVIGNTAGKGVGG